ncbi:MAG: glycogen debranching protein, partial [Phycisphaerae bacterium]|nr:glycogen debranching protein [Phycisphaerae bacterium]
SFVNDGLLPNRFPSPGEPPLDNAVDSPLLFIEMVRRTWQFTRDDSLVRNLAPVMQSIIDAYAKGTRHGIAMDANDSLIVAAEPGTQLTWMDARIGDRVVTPRMGKPVEINAMWHSALLSLAEMCAVDGGLPGVDAAKLTALAAKVKSSFGRFWSSHLNCLHDTIDGPGGHDSLVRPNQLVAVSLGRDLLPPLQAKSVVDRCMLDLWMPLGVRTLAPGSPGYEPRFGGPQERRDQAYHNGTAWPWLFGPLMKAHERVHQDHEAIADFMHPFVNHLREACVGQVSEVFDAEPPHGPGGCFAQAWSVAAPLSLWHFCR